MLNTQNIKEYHNINGFYLRINMINQNLELTSYNSNLLDGIKYESILNTQEIKKFDKIKYLSVKELYDLIDNKIKNKKIYISSGQNNIILILLERNEFNTNTDIQIPLLKNNNDYPTAYESVLSNAILNLKEENKNMRNEIDEIKNIIKSGGVKNLPINNSNRQSLQDSNIFKSQQINPSNNIILSQNILKNSVPNQINNQIQNPSLAKMALKSISNPPPGQIQNSSLNNKSGPLNNNRSVMQNLAQLDIESLSNLEYPNYPKVELSPNSFSKIIAYAYNSYHGIFKNNNEDKVKVILDYKLNKQINTQNGTLINPNISYFGIYDGHGGDKCSNFLQQKLDFFLFNSNYFPIYTLQALYDAFAKSEEEFNALSFDAEKRIMLDKSGSCALSALIMDEWCYVTYLGDSRGLYSFDGGNQLFQITRDHKPNDICEKTRIERAGGKIYKDTRLKINGQKVHVKEESVPGFKFPFRVVPGNLSVSLYLILIIILGCKNNW